ncbi:helicase-related protein [Sphingomonas oligoaromativorans]|uniref:helicase-related protein n=1 Tax=Sphingomonas oligoaromativorans TaxID=575322 RepID=UPI00141D8EA8|nr:helicase-related protein [Sphingomonas oligoaromativorans]NIJ34538.1 ATP-dependent RNA helicase SUPV3L1/SUV3 [Sphingomonas oligoaromativorans]
MGSLKTDRLVAVLGPTNTGKTHYAIERMCGHSSGLMGFPLRLLAREVYDRVVAIKGKDQVALLTGEEKILPPKARYFLCTAESMPTDRDFAFVALDEAQLGADTERGHVFTDRLLRARGREETLILGSEMLRPMLRALVPGIEIIGRPRFSTLTYAGPKKLSRLPKRSVVVAFSAEEVYAVAEMLRRLRGGAAVVMGALSPRTRNAQVAMYQAGEVDYLVATDAIGMGLNMDVAHVAFASLRKFDGRRSRRLTIPEMAQIAGRAGRHQRDGTFGTLGSEHSGATFEPEEVMAIEGHHFTPLDHLYWRCGTPDFATVDRLIASLEAKPDKPGLRAAPEAVDMKVLKRLAAEPDVAHRARGQAMTQRLWAACGLPDFRKTGPEHHARLVGRIFQHLSEGDHRLPAQWFADEIQRLDTVQGDVETIADRIAAARTWAYIAHRADWLAEPAHWAERTRVLEEKLSDALHERLTQRFVDRRTSVLLRDLSARGSDMLPVTIAEDGQVSVADEPIGHLTGFRFVADANARHADMKRLMAAAERRLGVEMARRAGALAGDNDQAFTLATDPGRPVAIFWRGDVVARLGRGRSLTAPRMTLHRTLDPLSPDDRARVSARLEAWLQSQIGKQLAPLAAIAAAGRDRAAAPALRGILAPVAEAGGMVAREAVEAALPALSRDQRRAAAHLGLKIGTLDLFVSGLLKPEAIRWRLALLAARADDVMPPLPTPGAAMIDRPDPVLRAAALHAGFRDLGDQMLRVDLVERLARQAHDAREGRRPFVPDPSLSTSLGLKPPSVARLMRTLGFARREGEGGHVAWLWRGRRPDRVDAPRLRPGNAFGALARLLPAQAEGAHG